MSYAAMNLLSNDEEFQARIRACVTEQADNLKNDERPDMSNVAYDALRGAPHVLASFYRLGGAAPGFADSVDNGDGTIDQSKVSDGEILSFTQVAFPIVADMWYDDNGMPWSGASAMPVPVEEPL